MLLIVKQRSDECYYFLMFVYWRKSSYQSTLF